MNTKLSLPKDRIRIVLLEGIHEAALSTFEAAGYTNVESYPKALPEDELGKVLEDAHVVGLRSRTKLHSEILARARRLFAIGCFCIGTDQVDLDRAAGMGVPVFHAPHSNTRSVAELVLGLTIMLYRGIFPKSEAAHRGEWLKTAQGSREIRGKTLGIVGYGHIGSQVSVLAEALGMRVLFHDIEPRLPMGNALPLPSLADLLSASDVVTFHVPDTEKTREMMGGQEIGRMKEGAFLINTSRGSVVDIDALAHALREHRLGGAAVDVFPREPMAGGEDFESPLRGIPEAILTPHIGGSTLEAQENIAKEVAHRLICFSDEGSTIGSVNFPELNLEPHKDCSRILHMHENRPGLLREITRIFAEKEINILREQLQTRNGVGYVVLDSQHVDREYILPALETIEGTIRARILY